GGVEGEGVVGVALEGVAGVDDDVVGAGGDAGEADLVGVSAVAGAVADERPVGGEQGFIEIAVGGVGIDLDGGCGGAEAVQAELVPIGGVVHHQVRGGQCAGNRAQVGRVERPFGLAVHDHTRVVVFVGVVRGRRRRHETEGITRVRPPVDVGVDEDVVGAAGD